MKHYLFVALGSLIALGQGCTTGTAPPLSTPAAKHISLAQGATEQQPSDNAPQCVILLHGLTRTSKSMEPLKAALEDLNYQVVNMNYPSRQFPVATLSDMAIPPALNRCRETGSQRIHFVTHSLGGILLRQYLTQHEIPDLHRVVMLAPPNKGSEIVDKLGGIPLFTWINGPAGRELGTDQHGLPQQLGKIDFELGVIAGTSTINLVLSLYLPNPDDGKVSVESTKVEGMQDFIALPVSHPYIMKNKNSITQIIHFLQQGRFAHAMTP